MKKNNENIILGFGLVLFITGIIWAALRGKNNDGMDEKGIFDNEKGEATEGGIFDRTGTTSKTYAEQPIKLKYFKISEFDSKGKGEKGTGDKMRINTLQMLDKARETANIPFTVNSGFRTIAHNKKVGGVPNSSHTKGYAADISAESEATQIKILKALYAAGFRRFGVYSTFIHVDNDPDKPSDLWRYGGTKYNPLTA